MSVNLIKILHEQIFITLQPTVMTGHRTESKHSIGDKWKPIDDRGYSTEMIYSRTMTLVCGRGRGEAAD